MNLNIKWNFNNTFTEMEAVQNNMLINLLEIEIKSRKIRLSTLILYKVIYSVLKQCFVIIG